MNSPHQTPPARIDDVDCGCGPTPAEARRLWPSVSRRSLVGAAALGIVLSATGLGLASPALAAKYPTWDDVEKARRNQASKNAEIDRIETLIRSLTNDVDTKQAEADRLGQEYVLAQEAYEDAVERADAVQAEADAETARAAEAAAKLGALAAEQYRTGRSDPTLELFFSDTAAEADELLGRLGAIDKIADANRARYADAAGARDNARNLSNQAIVARNERDRRKGEAEQKMRTAQAAAQAAQAALDAQTEHRLTLEAQLDALRDTTASTLAGYQAGVEAERKRREEARRKAREAAARQAREEEQRRREEERRRRVTGGRPSGASGASGNTGGSGGQVQSSGWVRPAHGWISSGFGTRGTICRNGYCTNRGHRGTDFASSCGSPIYAAAAGTVIFAGYSGAWGNYIKVQHRDGTITGYAHIIDGGYNVRYGQTVRAGQVIAFIGSTGASTGCHLHFEVYLSGVRVDPVPFLRARGIAV